MNALREEIGLKPHLRTQVVDPEFAHFDLKSMAPPLALEPRIIQAEPMTLRPAQTKATSVPMDLLRAATVLIPNQPTTEQWQTLKQAILDL